MVFANINSEVILNILAIATFFTAIILSLVLFIKMRQLNEYRIAVDRLKKALDEMDEQAKLIVRTDMELNRAQEELDKKISGLYALQKLSRLISTTLEEDQIFKRVELARMDELGFERACAFMLNKDHVFSPKMIISYLPEATESIKPSGELRELCFNLLKNEKPTSSISLVENSQLINKINYAYKVKSFVMAPILPKVGEQGILFMGTENPDIILSAGDEELVMVLANELGQAIENARLFEKSWRAQQDLENKVEERTSELTKALNDVKVISQRKTNFISSVSHELRTPLTSIKGYASILLAGKLGNIPEEIKTRLEKINLHSDELVHMVNDLLDIARIESGKMTMHKESLDLKVSVEKIVDLLSVQAKEKGIDLTGNVAPDASTAFADRSQIERVFINLMGNALKFTPEKGKITALSRRLNEKEVQIDIVDTGCGIPEEAQGKLFEEFYRVDNAINQEVKGTGLGLALVKHIVEAHGGKIWFKSKPGEGTTFSLTLPISG